MPDFADIAAELRRATVRVTDARARGTASGIVWRDPRTVVTNAHVVRSSRAVVHFADGRRFEARAIGRDTGCDLVVLELAAAAAVTPAVVRDASTLRPGELVVAVGYPLGLAGAVTAGVVHQRTARFVVADVRLAPGNSGGPLADAAGRVVGVNSMVAGGLALAVPAEVVRAFLGEVAGERAA
jgi:serine protease Do